MGQFRGDRASAATVPVATEESKSEDATSGATEEVETDIQVNESEESTEEMEEEEQPPAMEEEAAMETPAPSEYLKLHQAFDHLTQGAASFAQVCANLNDDRVKDGLCNPNLGPITSLNALQTAFN